MHKQLQQRPFELSLGKCCGQAVIARAIGTVTGEMWPSSYSKGEM